MKLIVLFAILILVAPVVAAEKIQEDTFTAELVVNEGSIYPNEIATYNLIIEEGTNGARYQLATIDATWILDTEPVLQRTVEGLNNYVLKVQPVSTVTFGPKIFELRLSNLDTTNTVVFNVPINIKNPAETPGVYVPSVQLEIEFDREIDPREQFILGVDLINRNNRILDPLTIEIDGELFTRTFETSLGGLKQRNQEIQDKIDSLTPPGSHKVTVKVIFEDKVIAEKERNYKVVGFNTPLEEVNRKFRLLDQVYDVTVTNNGNQLLTYDYNLEINWFSRLFLTSDDDFEVQKIDGERTAIITAELEPQETMTKRFVVHWNYLAIVILAIVLGLIGYYKLRNPVMSMKEILLESADKNISEGKVRIFIRNRSNKVLNNLRIIDKLPSIADLEKTERLGTLQPSKITKTKSKGTILRWEMQTLEPYEERIITYKFKSRLEIVGGMSLPPTKIVFEEKEGKERVAFSSEAKL